MSKFNSDNFIKSYSFFHKIIYVFAILMVVMNIFSKSSLPTNTLILICIFMILFFAADSIAHTLDYFGTGTFFLSLRYVEFFVFNIIQGVVGCTDIIIVSLLLLCLYVASEFVLYDSEYDSSNISVRKYFLLVPMCISAVLAFDAKNEFKSYLYFLIEILFFFVINIIVSWFEQIQNGREKERNELNLKISNIETDNTKLIEYQEKVKHINEQINYQKIDLAKANKELEQVNIEVNSQTEVMKYMTTTFDVLKCMNVLTDAIMDVKKPKLCAIYVDKNVYMNSLSSCIIKTNYSSMQRRLKKEIESIFEVVANGTGCTGVLYDDNLKQFKFIGDANINTLALLPFVDNNKVYGMMMVGSDDREFFSNGLGYYENCIVEFNVAVNRTKLYLKMQDMARKDGLTGIYNRVYFTELYEKALSDAKRKKKPISVALFDIDKFKRVNDTYGHIAGDKVIQMVASMGQKYADMYSGFTCRYGGEEFLLVLPDYDEEKALAVVEELHNEIKSTPVTYNDTEISVNVCIGLTSYPSLCDDTKILVSRADKAMYYGKKNGRGRLIVDNPSIDYEE